ncbi:hypothetical protein ILFOPFJJ_06332 [Ensifer psoraleae]|nr:hypothetical protein [Sinorhizobium psoraleae]
MRVRQTHAMANLVDERVKSVAAGSKRCIVPHFPVEYSGPVDGVVHAVDRYDAAPDVPISSRVDLSGVALHHHEVGLAWVIDIVELDVRHG